MHLLHELLNEECSSDEESSEDEYDDDEDEESSEDEEVNRKEGQVQTEALTRDETAHNNEEDAEYQVTIILCIVVQCRTIVMIYTYPYIHRWNRHIPTVTTKVVSPQFLILLFVPASMKLVILTVN